MSLAGKYLVPSSFVQGHGCVARSSAPQQRVAMKRRIISCEVAMKVEAQGSSSAQVGSRIRVKGPLKVFHVPKHPEFELEGQEGEVKELLFNWKGKTISANLPYKIQFLIPAGEDKPLKFVAHLREDEFEVLS